MSGEVLGEGRTADDEGQWRTADREKFLLLFSNAETFLDTQESKSCKDNGLANYSHVGAKSVV